MSGIAILLVGAVLCFAGVGSLHVAVLASGFGLGWLLAELLSLSLGTTFLFAAIGAVVVWVATTLIFKFAAFFIGIIAGAVVGAKLSRVLQPEDVNWILSGIVIVALAVACGFVADRYRARALLWLTALGGASMVLTGLGMAIGSLSFLDQPNEGVQQFFASLVWVAIAAAGWLTQRRLFPEKLRIDDSRARR
ncbi:MULTISPECIES: DUF4203 domain-containing protein [Rhodococcus]|uniref:DUF4203 domain-containing protein n=1 Tax=Rhodococcus wratislaviensis TaxID=44752 RepID=A0A402C0Z8_RHOWR|nr:MULTISPECIES: DUF4203 domain-containing protein [Rhodococcus]MBV6758456.1 DUF4203 domain-containing protein [Rhodococcus opacus]GCE37280.1 hypothetical protein Rhow_007524 [Rhodococcus wratislaviensis]